MIKKIISIFNILKEKKINELHKDKQINMYYSLIKTLIYNFCFNKEIYIGSKTIINNFKNIIITNKGRFEIALGDIGFISKETPTFINLRKSSKFIIDGIVCIGRGCKIALANNAILQIGNNSFLSGDSKIICTKKVIIGNNCAISWNVQILDNDFHKIFYKNNSCDDIIIGNNVWICSNVVILKGVNIGNNCVIGANSLINKSIPDNCFVAGNPAIIIKQNITWQI